MSARGPRYLLVALYRGPYIGLAPLEREFGASACAFLLDGEAAKERRRHGLPFLHPSPALSGAAGCLDFLRRGGYRALVRGVSKTPVRDNLETRLSTAAAKAGLPVYAIEDYPGNYTPDQPRADGLFVEFPSAKALHLRRGLRPSSVHVTGNPRYACVQSPPTRAERTALRARLGIGDEPAVLWAGQPNRMGNAGTLKALLPHLRKHRATLLYRSHPYTPADAVRTPGIKVIDVTAESDPIALARAADLVGTQFSTLAVEAGYAGVPGLFILLPGLGLDRHIGSTGEATPPWCGEGLAFLARSRSELGPALARALGDRASRARVLRGFQRLKAANRHSARRIARIIEASS